MDDDPQKQNHKNEKIYVRIAKELAFKIYIPKHFHLYNVLLIHKNLVGKVTINSIPHCVNMCIPLCMHINNILIHTCMCTVYSTLTGGKTVNRIHY